MLVNFFFYIGEKPFKCTYCEYATAQNSTLKIHLKRHHRPSQGPGMKTTSWPQIWASLRLHNRIPELHNIILSFYKTLILIKVDLFVYFHLTCHFLNFILHLKYYEIIVIHLNVKFVGFICNEIKNNKNTTPSITCFIILM